MNHQAIFALYPTVNYVRGDVAFDINGNEVTIDRAAVNAWVDPDEYKINRKRAYPSIQEQLDMQYWDSVNGTTIWADTIAQVKADYPKGGE